MFEVSVHERNGEPFVLQFSQPEITIGRAGGNDVVLPRNSVSKRHAKVIAKNGKFIAVDQGSTNGTIVNGQKITAPRVLKAGERMVVGDYVLAFRVRPTESPTKPATSVASRPPHPVAPPEPAPAASELAAPAAAEEPDTPQGDPNETDLTAVAGSHRELELPPMDPGDTGQRPTQAQEPISLGEWGTNDIRSTVNQFSSSSTMMLRAPADLFRAERSDVSSQDEDSDFDRSALWSPEVIEAYGPAITALLSRVPAKELPSSYPPRDEDVTRFRSLADGIVGELDLDATTSRTIRDAIVHEATGLGPIEFYLDDPDVREVHVNHFDTIYLRRGNEMERAPLTFGSAETLQSVVDRIMIGADLDDALGGAVRLPDGTRMELVLPPASTNGPVMSLRKATKATASMSELIEAGTLSDAIAKALIVAATHGGSVVIATQHRHDATLLLNALVNEVPRSRRVVTVEAVQALSPHSDAVVRLEQAPGTLPTPVARALAIEPEMLVIDPLGDGLVIDWLSGASSRSCSTVATLSARSPTDALARLLLLALEGRRTEASAVRRQLGANLDLIVHLRRNSDGGLLVNEVVEVTVSEGGELNTSGVFRSKNGPSGIEFSASGHVPSLFATLSEAGEAFDGSIFNA